MSSGLDPRPAKRTTPFVDIFFMGQKGGSGGIYGTDGYDHIGMIDASGGVLDQDYEIFEQATPHLVLTHELLEDSAGPGRWRGGLGTEASYRVGTARSPWSPSATATWSPPTEARAGWTAPSTSSRSRYPGETQPVHPDAPRTWWSTCPRAPSTTRVSGGGGGWGDPRARDPQKVLRDVRNGVVSLESARRDYGVAIDPESWTVDEGETGRLTELRSHHCVADHGIDITGSKREWVMTKTFMPDYKTDEELEQLQLEGLKWTCNHVYDGLGVLPAEAG